MKHSGGRFYAGSEVVSEVITYETGDWQKNIETREQPAQRKMEKWQDR